MIAGSPARIDVQQSSTDPSILKDLRPHMAVLYGKEADLDYCCDALPGGNLLGGHKITLPLKVNGCLPDVGEPSTPGDSE